jgi:hypothetical protein
MQKKIKLALFLIYFYSYFLNEITLNQLIKI